MSSNIWGDFQICISVPLKLLPSLFELKDNDTVVMSTIIKKLQDMSQNRSLFISEVGKTVRFLLLSQTTNAESDELAHIHNNILDNINLSDVANQFVDRKDNANKQTFSHLSQNCSLEL